jgi:16S rRNA (guanine(966)-N(2))-methyltransferase RsmD
LDLFAGSGSLGLEALSRGAAWADFVEWDRRQCAVIEHNLSATGFASQARVHRNDVARALVALPGGYGLALLDPPYRMDGIGRVLDAVASRKGLVIAGGVVVAGHSKRVELDAQYGDLRRTSHRQYGDNMVDFFLMGESASTGGEIW